MTSFAKGDNKRFAIPVKRTDRNEWLTEDGFDFNEIKYKITSESGFGDIVVTFTDEDDEIELFDASEINNNRLREEGVPDNARVVTVRIPESKTQELDAGFYYHELEIDFDRFGEQTVMGPSRIQITESRT